jgi:hypothetical protein
MNVLAALLAVAAAVAMVVAVLVMTVGEFGLAGGLFLSASIVIYLRERWA